MMTMRTRKSAPKSIAVFDALWARVSSWHRDVQTLLLQRTVWRRLCKSFKVGYHCVEASPAISSRCEGSRTEATSAQQSVLNSDSVHRQRWAGDRPTRKSMSSWIIMLDGFLISAGTRTQSVTAQSSCDAEYIAATAATSEAKNIQALFLACGQHVNIHLRSDSSGAIGVASRRGLQRLRSISVVAGRRPPTRIFESARSLGLRNVADANTKLADKRSLELCRSKMGVTEIPKQFRASFMITCAAPSLQVASKRDESRSRQRECQSALIVRSRAGDANIIRCFRCFYRTDELARFL